MFGVSHFAYRGGGIIEELDSNMLRFAIENGIIDSALVQQQIRMKRTEEILKEHPYEIFYGKDEYWHTYVRVEKGKRKAIKRKKREDVEDMILKYANGYRPDTFKTRFEVWKDRQVRCGRSENTISKYDSDYKRFFQGDEFENMCIREIDDIAISEFIIRLLKRKKIPYKALLSLYGYLNGVFRKSVLDQVIDQNPCVYVDLPIFRKFCTERRRQTAKERVVSQEEKEIILRKIHESMTQPNFNIARLAVELAFYTGMRVGELAALRWEDIDYDEGVIVIQNSEKKNRQTKECYISSTKNNKIRFFPITEEIKEVLDRTYKMELKYGYLTEFVFSNQDGRIRASSISSAMRRLTDTKEFAREKSIHAIRRTLNSNLRYNGVSATVAASLLGHSERINEDNYTYDVMAMSEKADLIKQAYK